MKLRSLAAGALALAASTVGLVAVDAGPVATSVVAVLADGNYVDTGPMGEGGEVVNVVEDLEASGHTVRQIEEATLEAFTTALDGAEVLVVPELEISGAEEFMASVPSPVFDLIQDFVDGGGRILFFGSSQPDAAINGMFGFAVESFQGCGNDEGGEWPPCVITTAAANTEFADGPAELSYVDDTSGLLVSSLPSGSTVAYEVVVDDQQGEEEAEVSAAALVPVAGVASMPYGHGAVVFYGWDWFPSAFFDEPEGGEVEELSPAGIAEEAGWATVLDLGVSQPTVTATGGTGELTFTTDSPSTQPVFVEYVTDGGTAIAEIAPGTTSVVMSLTGPVSVAWSVPGWGVGEGSVDVLGTAVTPTPTPTPTPAPATPVVASPSFTG